MTDAYLEPDAHFATKAIHVGQEPERWTSMAVVPPICLSTTFKQPSPNQPKQFDYSRSGNPSRDVLEQCLAALDDAKHALCFASGLGATTTLMGLYSHGDHVIVGDDVYGGTGRLLRQVIERFGIEITFLDTTDLPAVERAIRPNTKLIMAESPTNPLFKVTDIKALAVVAKKHNVTLAIDNTFLTSYLQRPLTLGADIVLYSLTKYMNGHSDAVMGALVMNDPTLFARLKFLQNAMGIVPAPFDCAMVNRSLKTLALRMEKHKSNGLLIAQFLEKHPRVEKVIHPGLASHPQYDIFKRQTAGHSGVMSFYIRGGLAESKKFLESLEVFALAESLGGYESLAELPSIMTHASVPAEERERLGITDSLIRISVGLECADDLIGDLERALATI